MAFVTLEDFSGKGDCIVFSDAYRQYNQFLTQDSMIMVVGTAEPSGDALKIIAREVIPIEKVVEKFGRNVHISIQLGSVKEETIGLLKDVIKRHKGKYPCYFNVLTNESEQPYLLQSEKYAVNPDENFVNEVESILGPASVRFSP